MSYENVDQPKHYQGEGGITAIDVIEAYRLNFSLGNVIKYALRAGRKPNEDGLQDLEKALWYLNREVERVRWERSDIEGLGAYTNQGGEWGAVTIPAGEVAAEIMGSTTRQPIPIAMFDEASDTAEATRLVVAGREEPLTSDTVVRPLANQNDD